MLFNSLEFGVFLAAVLIAWSAVPRTRERARKGLLVAASYAFYMSWNPPFALLLLFSTLLDFSLAQRMAREGRSGRRRVLLVLSLVGNLGLLGYFKYGAFFYDSLHSLFGGWLSLGDPTPLDIILPVGISFYTFQTLSYSIDVYRGAQRPTRSLLDFALYVSFFPQLVAGPIVRSRDFLPQLERPAAPDIARVETGVWRILTGLVKKVVLADTLALYVDGVFDDPSATGGLNVWLALYAYSYQIYFDFSGYSDIAIGLAAILGFRIPENFDRPYRAASMGEFWRRWHISLSTWLRDYLYIPLGGNRRSAARTLANLFLTMLLGGLWHGASWNFVLWGAYHGALLALERIWPRRPAGPPTPLGLAMRRFAIFNLVSLGWIPFRSPSLEASGEMVAALRSVAFEPSLDASRALLLVALCALLHLGTQGASLQALPRRFPAWAAGVAIAATAAIIFLFSPSTGRFIYFRF